MAINIHKLKTGSVAIEKDGRTEYYSNQTNVKVLIPNPDTIEICFSKGSIILPYSEIGTIDDGDKPETIEATAEVLADEIFEKEGGTGGSATTVIPIELDLDQEEITLDWTPYIGIHGTIPTTVQLLQLTLDSFSESNIKFTTSDNGLTYKWQVGTQSSRFWEIRLYGYTDEALPLLPIPTAPDAPTNGIVNNTDHTFTFTKP